MSLAAQGIGTFPSSAPVGAPVGPAQGDAGTLVPDSPRGPGPFAVLTGSAGVGNGGSYRPHPALPPADHLDYANKFVRFAALLIVVVYALKHPALYGRLVGKHAGVS